MCRTPTHNICAVQSVHKPGTHTTRSSHTDCSVIFVRLKIVLPSGVHVSHPWLTHLPISTSKSSFSFTLPSTTTQEHAAQPVRHDLLREHPMHHEPLQALPVDKQRHQESLWRENPAEWRKPAHELTHPQDLFTAERNHSQIVWSLCAMRP